MVCLKTKAGRPLLWGLPQSDNNLYWLRSHPRRTFLLLFLLPGLLTAKAQVPLASEPRFWYIILTQREEPLQETEDPTALPQLYGQQPHPGWKMPLPPLIWATKSHQHRPGVSAQVTTTRDFMLSPAKAEDQLRWPCHSMWEDLHSGHDAWSPIMSLGCYKKSCPSSEESEVSLSSPSWSHLPQFGQISHQHPQRQSYS